MKKLKFSTISILLALGIMLIEIGCLPPPPPNKFLEKPSSEGISTGRVLSIPDEILTNKFGFLSGAPGSVRRIKEFGAAWARPHPGPFLWDSMQKSKSSKISFARTDRLVKEYQKEGIGLLVTLWPFAEWDQKERSDASKCMVSENDEFLPKRRFFKEEDYLPRYRCNPHDWEAYQKWVSAVVERYDGDGINDMPGLKIPIKYWEVMNEPDLTSPEEEEGLETTLDFYKQDAEAYRELLIRTSEAIRKADPEAKILIAGAAGGSEKFLSFYREVLKDKRAVSAFDIANVHCISNDDYQSFNVAPYKKMLQELGINKPIWVTEAEAIISDDPDVNAAQTFQSTKRALELGAEKIFFTRYDFEMGFDEIKPPIVEQPLEIEIQIDGSDPVKAYRKITSQ
jgi:hypothetical protein